MRKEISEGIKIFLSQIISALVVFSLAYLFLIDTFQNISKDIYLWVCVPIMFISWGLLTILIYFLIKKKKVAQARRGERK